MTEKRFWDERYRTGLSSGKGSVGDYRKWKWNLIEKYVNIKDKCILDVGCGDLQFLKRKKFKDYFGIDISPTIIARNKKRHRKLSFAVLDATWHDLVIFQRDVVLCMDVLFHIMDDERFGILLDNLNKWTGQWLFVVSWSKNPLPYQHDDYQYYRDLKKSLDRLPDLELVGEHQKKGDEHNTLYVFRRKAP